MMQEKNVCNCNGVVVRQLTPDDIPIIIQAFQVWPKPAFIFKQYLCDTIDGRRVVWLAYKDESVVGYVTLKWCSTYPFFKDNGIPEINDLAVLPAWRGQGIGTCLLEVAEEYAAQRSAVVGLGVALSAQYGAAQCLYIKRGYVPDGKGITYNYEYVAAQEHVCIDDNCILWLVKKCTQVQATM